MSIKVSAQKYDNINQVMKKMSNRTLEMKTNNVKLFNKVSFEMNNLLVKCQEIIRICLTDRNEFIKDMEALQFDFFELSKLIDQDVVFDPSKDEKSKEKTNLNENEKLNGKANLKRLLNDSNSSNEDCNETRHDESTESTGIDVQKPPAVIIPDTCYVDLNPIRARKPELGDGKRQLVIRDTIDSNMDELFVAETAYQTNGKNLATIHETTRELAEANDANEKTSSKVDNAKSVIPEKDLDETCCSDDNLLLANNHNLIANLTVNTSQSTPLAVKKKLQEHGLLDLTNSPAKTFESPLKKTTNTKKNSAIVNKKNPKFSTNSPVKYIQRQFSPIRPVESPLKTADPNSKTTTPVKLVLLKTPTKSPSIITGGNILINKNNPWLAIAENEDKNEDKSFDYSFEFREQAQKNSLKTGAGSTDSMTSIASSSISVGTKNTTNKSNTTTTGTKSTQISSSNRSKDTQNRPKRLKQLTMTQALCTQSDTISKSNSCSNFGEVKTKETTKKSDNQPAINEYDFNNENLNSRKSKISQIRIKEEPYLTDQMEAQENTNGNQDDDIDATRMELNNYENEAFNRKDYFDDFDKVPKKKTDGPNFKHIEVVRRHDERKKLETFSCKECEQYWNSLPEHMRPKRMEDNCRHRAKYQAPATPEHYWSIGFPTTQECLERGYGGVTVQNDKEDQITSKRPRRKRPLKIQLNTDKNQIENEDENNQVDFDFGD